MFGVRIRNSKSSAGGGKSSSVNLRGILAVVGEPARTSRWRCRDLRYLSRQDGGVNEFFEERLRLTGEEMLRFAAAALQVIDGRFEAHSGGAAKRPWLIVLAVDSSWFEVWSSKPAVLESVREHFQEVSDIPTAAA